jgi:hypothetical protein
MYYLHPAFPDIVGSDSILEGFDYVRGRPSGLRRHIYPASAPPSSSPTVTIAPTAPSLLGGMIPNVVIIQPDFAELKSDGPFLWYENEYVVDTATIFILAANSAEKEFCRENM